MLQGGAALCYDSNKIKRKTHKRPYYRECSRRCGRFLYVRRDTMRSLLEEFWFGNVYPQEQYTNRHPDVNELLRLMDKNRIKLTETLTEAQKEVLQKYDDACSEMSSIMERELFVYAFRLGGRFMVETLFGEDDK